MVLIPFFIFFIFFIYRYKVGIHLLYVNTCSVIIFGIIIDGDYSLNSYLISYLISNTLVLIGYSIVKELKVGVGVYAASAVKINYLAIQISFLIISFVIFLHYAIVGIPFLSESFDSVRFLQANSGYLGIPSRFASYMPSIMMLTLVFYLFHGGIRVWQRRIMTALVLVVFILQGHKSSLLQVVLLGVVAYPYCDIKSQLKGSFKWFFVLSLMAGYFLFTQLVTTQDLQFFKYVISRLSTMMHSSGEYLIELDANDFTFFMNNPVINDLLYPINKLFNSEYEALNTQLSRKIYGVDDGDFSVPVTPGFFAYHYFSLGLYPEKIYSFLIGVIVGLLDQRSRLTMRPMIKVSYVFISYWLYIGYTSGNLYYLIPNVIFCLTFFILFYSAIVSFLKSIKE